jgi:fatty acid desaturase
VSMTSASELRRRIKQELPASTFRARPLRILWFLPLLTVAVLGVLQLAKASSGGVASVALVIVVGNTYASMLLLAHETMHGALLRSRRWQNRIAWIGFAPFLISPTLWRVWHNEVHHGHANEIDRDPDIFAGEAMHASTPTSRLVLRFVPGAGGILSVVFPFVWFCLHGQIVMWFLSSRMQGFEGLDRRRAKAELALVATGWLLLAWWLGAARAPVAILAPMAVGNCVLMSYIATNHLLRPLVKTPNPLRSSMSVRAWPLFDRLHFCFSHHVEHHLFPAMSGAGLPKIRRWLLAEMSEAYCCPAHWQALLWLCRTPRTYRDENTLVDPRRPARAQVDLDELALRLGARSVGASGLAASEGTNR